MPFLTHDDFLDWAQSVEDGRVGEVPVRLPGRFFEGDDIAKQVLRGVALLSGGETEFFATTRDVAQASLKDADIDVARAALGRLEGEAVLMRTLVGETAGDGEAIWRFRVDWMRVSDPAEDVDFKVLPRRLFVVPGRGVVDLGWMAVEMVQTWARDNPDRQKVHFEAALDQTWEGYAASREPEDGGGPLAVSAARELEAAGILASEPMDEELPGVSTRVDAERAEAVFAVTEHVP